MKKKSTEELIHNLRIEYLGLNDRIARASFALSTMEFDEKERELLSKQITLEVQLMQVIEQRAQYATGYKGETK